MSEADPERSEPRIVESTAPRTCLLSAGPRYLVPMRTPLTCRGSSLVALLFCAASVNWASAQYASPESVEYDPVGDRYFVSNLSSQLIRYRDQAGTVTTLVDVGDAPYGLELLGDTLYACVGGSVKGFSTSDGTLVFDLDLNASFLNGITTDGSFLYVTDFGSSRIYKVDPVGNSYETLVSNTNGTPNGIVWDPVGERLVVVFWNANAPIKGYDRETGAAQTLVANTGLGNIDGITIDCLGNFLVASWSPDRISRFEPTFTQPAVDLGIAGLNNPADIDFDTVNDRVCIPNGPLNSVVLADVNCSTGIPEHRTYATVVIPNPTSGLVRIDPPFTTPEPFMVLDSKGALQASGTLRENALLDLATLPSGLYTILFTRHAQQVQVVKE